MIRERKKLYKVIALFFACITLFCSLINKAPVRAETAYPFDQTNVLDDLQSSEDFNLYDWPWDSTGLIKGPQIMNFVEWCYSPFKTDDFALYIYFYNPENIKVDVDSYSNRIQMASAYDNAVISETSKPTDYETFNLVYCNKSEKAGYEGLFYKFRVVDHESADGKTIAERVYTGERRYDVSGVALMQEDGTVKEYTVGGTYFFTGYAAGYGANESAESTLECTGFKPMETISLEVHDTNYRTESSSLGKYHENEVTSVYFSVPNRFFEKYGNLQKIKAEWREYETKEIFIVNNDRYSTLLPFVGINIGENTSDLPLHYWKEVYGLNVNGISKQYDWTYNVKLSGSSLYTSDYILDTLYWLFPADDRVVTPAQMRDYVENYTKTYNNGKIPVNSGNISADLFKEGLSEDRAAVPYVGDDIHHKLVNFDANDDKFNLLSYDSTHSGWERFCDYFFNWSNAPSDSSLYGVSPIEYENIGKYINYSDANLSSLLLINEADCVKFREFYNESKENGETTVLFRFAQTDYYQEGLRELDDNHYSMEKYKGYSADVAETTVFLDFKIIHLTFMDEDANYTVIPVTQDPIDIYNGLSPTEKEPWQALDDFGNKVLAWIIFIISIIVGLIAIWLLSLILKAENSIGNPIVKIVFIILTLALAGVGIYFGVAYVINVITGLGGLF